MPRFHVDLPLCAGLEAQLEAATARHVQVLRMQPGQLLTLFDGRGGEWEAAIVQMGRRDVIVRVGTHLAVDRELPLAVTLALGMPANDRMDWLVEKATELGVAAIQPLLCERSVLRLQGERADRRIAHWQGVATAAAEQSGRTRLPVLHAVRSLADWLTATCDTEAPSLRVVLSLAAPCESLIDVVQRARPVGSDAGLATAVVVLSGPEGGLSVAEEAMAHAQNFRAVSLGPRVLRADTAPLAILAALASRP